MSDDRQKPFLFPVKRNLVEMLLVVMPRAEVLSAALHQECSVKLAVWV